MALSEKLVYFRQSCPRFREVFSGYRHWSTESNWQFNLRSIFFLRYDVFPAIYWLKYPHRCLILLMLLFICNIGEDYLVMVCEQSHTQIHAYRLALWLQTSKWRSLNSLWNGHGPCFHVEFRECITPSISLYHYIIISVYLYISSDPSDVSLPAIRMKSVLHAAASGLVVSASWKVSAKSQRRGVFPGEPKQTWKLGD